MDFRKWILIYLVGINLLTFVLFCADKWKAVHGRWRISERTLLGFALIGGAVGGLLGMLLARHKVRVLVFQLGVPAMILLHGWILIKILGY